MKPVAWMLIDKEWNDACRYFSFPMENAIPLYTAPRELSDNEIVALYESSYLQSGLDEWEFDPVYFARAILKRASEK